MLNWVAKVFRGCFEAILWIGLIGFIIAGGVAGNIIGRYSYNGTGGYIFLGIILGGIIGLIVTILSGGLVANFLNMVDNIAKLAKNENVEVPTKEIGNKFKVKLLTNVEGLGIRKGPNAAQEPFTRLPNGTEVELLEVGSVATLNTMKGSWYKIKTDDGIQGWCFSGSLERI
jgi:hypothetical protein